MISESGMDLDFLAGGGGMGERIRAYPWAHTPLGDPQFWPQSLRTVVRLVLATQHPMFIFWGPEHTCLYNDAYSRSLGSEKHPSILGKPGRQSWEEIWPIIGPQIEQVMRGDGATWHENQLVPIIRHGELQDVYWTYGYSPIDEPSFRQGVGGVLVVCTETTEQMQTERRLSAERERFVQLFDQAPTFLALLRGKDHVIELVNPGYQKLIGQRSVVGRTVADALPDAVAQGYLTILDQVYSTGKPHSAAAAKYAVQSSPDGPIDVRYLDYVYQPITECDGAVSGVLVQGVDVTSRAAGDDALAFNLARLDYATRLSGIGFWYCDLPFDELKWDERVKDHFFFEPTARITIDDFYARIHEEDRERTREAIDGSIRHRTPYDIIYRTVHPSTGVVKWIRALGGTDYASDGTPIRFDGVTVDVSAQKLNEEQLREQDRHKDEFLATLAHELRNPLAPIRTAASLLEDAALNPEAIERSRTIIARQVRHMATLLDDLLEVSRISRGVCELRKERSSLQGLLAEALETARPVIDAKSHRLILDWPSEPSEIEADPVRFVQVVTNLLTNAAKYTDPEGEIFFGARIENDGLLITVRDSGIGLSPDMLPKLFEMFSQVNPHHERTEGGLGIGLALVKGLVELHGGHVEARSEGLERGSEFTVSLPGVHVATGIHPLSPAAATVEPTSPIAVLVADDNRDGVESLAMLLEFAGHQVHIAHTGVEAFQMAKQHVPRVAILDIGMPGLSGYELAKRIRSQPWGSEIVLIAMTGWGHADDKRRAHEAGFDHHLTKPVDPDTLEQLITTCTIEPAFKAIKGI